MPSADPSASFESKSLAVHDGQLQQGGELGACRVLWQQQRIEAGVAAALRMHFGVVRRISIQQELSGEVAVVEQVDRNCGSNPQRFHS